MNFQNVSNRASQIGLILTKPFCFKKDDLGWRAGGGGSEQALCQGQYSLMNMSTGHCPEYLLFSVKVDIDL